MNKLITEKIKAAVIQDTTIKQLASAQGKNLVINCPIMINGNDAIERACAKDGDIIGAIKHILSVLPEPKIFWLKVLAIVAALEIVGGKKVAGEYLGVNYNVFNSGRYKESIKAIQNGEITFGEEKRGFPEELPR